VDSCTKGDTRDERSAISASMHVMQSRENNEAARSREPLASPRIYTKRAKNGNVARAQPCGKCTKIAEHALAHPRLQAQPAQCLHRGIPANRSHHTTDTSFVTRSLIVHKRSATSSSLPALLKGAGEQRTKCAPVMLSDVANAGSVAKCKVQNAP